jgi:hypothetical protein
MQIATVLKKNLIFGINHKKYKWEFIVWNVKIIGHVK